MSGPRERCGRFTLGRRLGAGGMGEIFLAEDDAGGRYALKRLLAEAARDPVFVGMFLDEARLVERMEHPNVCRVYEHGAEGRHHFLVMDLIDGVSLAELLRTHGALPVPLACRVVAEIAAALDYAHRLTDENGVALRIVHRDVTPANVMISREGDVKLVDFGLAKARTQLMKTTPGLVKGKFGYLSPEQLAGTVDFRTDVFGMGLCLYEALRGEALFGQRTAASTVQAIRAFEGPPRLTGLVPLATPALDDVLARALAPRAADRFESAAAMRVALGRVVRDLGHAAVGPEQLAAHLAGHERDAAPGTSTESAPPPPPVSDPPEGRAAPRAAIWFAAGLGAALTLGLMAWAFLS